VGLPYFEPDFYVQEFEGRIIADLGGPKGTELDIGHVEVWKILATQACNDGVALFDVFDAHSDFLVAAYGAVFTDDEEPRPELGVEPGYNDILVLSDYTIRADYRPTRLLAEAFEVVIRVLDSSSIVIAAVASSDDALFEGLELRPEEWQQLGFLRIVGTQFAIRDNCSKNPYKAIGDYLPLQFLPPGVEPLRGDVVN